MPSIDELTASVARHRQRMRATGLQPVQFWAPDTRTPEFAVEIRNQCRSLKGGSAETDVLRFTEAAATHVEGWECENDPSR